MFNSVSSIATVGQVRVRVRGAPSLSGEPLGWLNPGEPVVLEPEFKAEADGYVWRKHAAGWSVECTADGCQFYLVPDQVGARLSDPDLAAGQAVTVGLAQPAAVVRSLDVGRERVRVRDRAGLSGTTIGWLSPGERISVLADSRVEIDGYVWYKHDGGWSAEKTASGSPVFLYPPGTAPKRLQVEQTGPALGIVDVESDGLTDIDKLPLRDGLFKYLPVPLEQTTFWQYYGNNVFAYNLWREGKTWYKYSQGLHAGLDFGNASSRGVFICAGVEGVFESHRTQAYKPNDLRVTVGPYTIIYGHLANPRLFQRGQPIRPDTVIGEIEVGYPSAAAHLHLEVRYNGKWIVNPLLLMTPEMRQAILLRFPPGANYFYQEGGWNRWITPLDQPVITLGGAVLGPHA